MKFIKNLSLKEKLSLINIILFIAVSCCGCICVETIATAITGDLEGVYKAGDVIAENYKTNCVFITLPLSVLQIFILFKKQKLSFFNIVFATICLICSVCYKFLVGLLFPQIMGGLYSHVLKITPFGYVAIIFALINVVFQILLYKNYKTSE